MVLVLVLSTTVVHAQAIVAAPAAVVVPVPGSAPVAALTTAAPAPDGSAARPTGTSRASPASATPIRTEQIAVSGSAVPAGRVHTEVRASYATVCGMVTDFARFREVFPLRESRVIHRRRGQIDVYFRVELARGAGTLWALSRFSVQRSPGVTRVDSRLIDGNLRRLDVSFEVRPVVGDPSRATLSMQLLGLPTFYFPEGLLGVQQTRWAERGIALLRARAESFAPPPAAAP